MEFKWNVFNESNELTDYVRKNADFYKELNEVLKKFGDRPFRDTLEWLEFLLKCPLVMFYFKGCIAPLKIFKELDLIKPVDGFACYKVFYYTLSGQVNDTIINEYFSQLSKTLGCKVEGIRVDKKEVVEPKKNAEKSKKTESQKAVLKLEETANAH